METKDIVSPDSSNSLQKENENLKQTVVRLKNLVKVHERGKAASDELIRVLNATLMERETEISILKLKMTRLQANPCMNSANLNSTSSISSIKQDPSKTLAASGRSNSEFCRNSYVRSSMIAEAASARSSTSQLQTVDKDASIWATVPAELTPSRRPLLLERNFQPFYSGSHYNPYGSNGSSMNHQSSTPILRDRRYKTLPRSMKSPSQEFSLTNDKPVKSEQNQASDTGQNSAPPKNCLITNLDDSGSTNNSNSDKKDAPPANTKIQLVTVRKPLDLETNKPFAEWDTDMLADWLSRIGLSMYSNQCKRWVKCGAHIMNATPVEVDKGLGITNHLHRKKLRLAISELNGDCDKVTKAAAKLDYLWVARWLDDIGLPQHKDAFINARVDGRVLNYLTVEDLISMNVKSVLHHASIRCGIRVLRSIGFDLQLLRRRATAEECEEMNLMRQRMEINNTNKVNSDEQKSSANFQSEIPMWTCHRVMEWLRMIEFSEFAPNLRGSGVHGGLIMFEDGFNVDTMCTLLSIPASRTLLRRHLSSYFELLIGEGHAQRKKQFKEQASNQQLNPAAEIKASKKSPWFGKLRSLKVSHEAMDDYLCPMYPVEPQLIKSPFKKVGDFGGQREHSNLPKIPESINV